MIKQVAVVPTPEQCQWLSLLSGPLEIHQSQDLGRFATSCFLRGDGDPLLELTSFAYRATMRRECWGICLRTVDRLPADAELVAATRCGHVKSLLWESSWTKPRATSWAPALRAPSALMTAPAPPSLIEGDLTVVGVLFVLDDRTELLAHLDDIHPLALSLTTDRRRIDLFTREFIAVPAVRLAPWIASLTGWEKLPVDQMLLKARCP